MKFMAAILALLLLTACATTPLSQETNDYLKMRLADIEANRPPDAEPSPPPEPSAGQILATILLAPLWIPLVGLASDRSYYRDVHCKSYTYKDQFHSKCY